MFTFNNGFGYAEGSSVVVYDNVGNVYSQEINPTDEVKKEGKGAFPGIQPPFYRPLGRTWFTSFSH